MSAARWRILRRNRARQAAKETRPSWNALVDMSEAEAREMAWKLRLPIATDPNASRMDVLSAINQVT